MGCARSNTYWVAEAEPEDESLAYQNRDWFNRRQVEIWYTVYGKNRYAPRWQGDVNEMGTFQPRSLSHLAAESIFSQFTLQQIELDGVLEGLPIPKRLIQYLQYETGSVSRLTLDTKRNVYRYADASD
jgi:SOCS box